MVLIKFYFTGCPSWPSLVQSALLTCKPNDDCTGIHCCAAIDVKVKQIFTKIWIAADRCKSTLSIGFGNWTETIQMDETGFGTEKQADLGDALQIQ